MTDDTPTTPARELAVALRAVLDDVASFYRGEADAALAPVRDAWGDRPWWLRRRRWRDALRPLVPQVGSARRRLRREVDRGRVASVLDDVSAAWPDLVITAKLSDTIRSWAYLVVGVERTLAEAAPVVERLVADGWVVDDVTDDERARRLRLKRDDREVEIRLKIRIGQDAACEIVEHVRTEERVEYEIVCEGESELTGLSAAAGAGGSP